MTNKTIAVAALSLIALLAMAASGASAGDCPAGTKKIGERRTETADKVIIQPRCQRLSAAEIDGEIARLDREIATHRAKIDDWRHRYLPQLQGDIHEWEHLAREARADVYITAGSAILGTVLDDRAARERARRVLLEEERAHLKEILPLVERAGKDEYRLLGREIREAKRSEHLLEIADRIRQVFARGAPVVITRDEQVALTQTAMFLLNLGLRDPRARLLAEGGEVGAAVLWEHKVLAVGIERVEQLSRVAESHLTAIAALTRLYRDRIDERAALRKIRAGGP